MIIGGTSIKEWELKSNKKKIPEYFIKDPKFINALINEVGDYVEGDPVSCLIKLKEKAWELVPLWKDKGKEAHLFKELWKLQTIIKCLAKTRILRKTSTIHSFSSLELELLHTAAIEWNGSQDDKKWRIQFLLESKDGQYLSNSMHGIFSEIQTDSKICHLLDVEIHPLSSGCLCQHKNLHSYLMLSSLGLKPPTVPSNCF